MKGGGHNEKEAKKILLAALEWESPEDRKAYLDQACRDDPTIRDTITNLFGDPGVRARSPVHESDACLGSFGDYMLIEEIARGGMGVVFKAEQTRLKRIVALKMILSGQLAGEEEVRRFHIEAEAAAKLDHPGIVQIYEIGEHGGQHYFSMRFVEGKSLAAELREGPWLPRAAAELVKSVAQAVAYAHGEGVIHRDLKPGNILLDPDGQPHITDFGLARKLDEDSGLTMSGQILGTPSYMPPEQASGNREDIGVPSDVYALGAILYALLTGGPPFRAATPVDTLAQVLDSDPVPPRLLNATIPRELEAICMKCLEKPPLKRYATAADLARDLGAFLEGEPVAADTDTTSRLVRAMLRESRHEEVLYRHAKAWRIQAIVIFFLLLGTNVLVWLGRSDTLSYVSLWTPGLVLLFLPAWACLLREGRQFTPVEKQMMTVWWMFIVIALLTGGVTVLTGGSMLELLPIIILELAFGLGCTAVVLRGSFYVLAVLCAASAPLVALIPSVGPLVFGTAVAIGLSLPGWKYSRKPKD